MLERYNQNLHMHGVLCDGRDEYEDTVQRAMALGFDGIGFSGHSWMPYSPSYGMSVENTEKYKAEIARLKQKYSGQIDVYCGIELDMFSPVDVSDFDYVIGSVHYFRMDGGYVGFDRSAEAVRQVIDEHFGGDGMKYAKAYYETLCRLPDAAPIDIVGNFDLIAKHAETHDFFDMQSPEYRKWAVEAIEVLAKRVGVFEINTGAIARGYRTTPYPDPYLLGEIRRLGGQITISSDCHDNRYIDCGFDDALELARSCGFREVLKLTPDGFRAFAIR